MSDIRMTCELDVIAAVVAAHESGCTRIPISVTWSYHRDDPYAVRMSFPTCGGVTWFFSRDLLVDGIEDQAGDGDVHILTAGGPGGDVTLITIGVRWTDQASLIFHTGDLVAFLALTDDVVALGAESPVALAELAAALASCAAPHRPDTTQES
ncbi:MAG: SsgA family sporulation/cell division regulator [Dehalococcoidia bacterium]